MSLSTSLFSGLHPSPAQERVNYGCEQISGINSNESAFLNGSRVAGPVSVEKNLEVHNAITASAVKIGADAMIVTSICRMAVDAAGDIEAKGSQFASLSSKKKIIVHCCQIPKGVIAETSIVAWRCWEMGDVKAKELVDICECQGIKSVFSGSEIVVRNSSIESDVTAQKSARVENSKIGGTLTCFSDAATIDASTIDTIFLLCHTNRKRRQLLTLQNSKVKNIVFEGRRGRVLLKGTSRISGTVTGGRVSTT